MEYIVACQSSVGFVNMCSRNIVESAILGHDSWASLTYQYSSDILAVMLFWHELFNVIQKYFHTKSYFNMVHSPNLSPLKLEFQVEYQT